MTNISSQAPAVARTVLGRVQQSVVNPVVRLAWDLRLPIPGDALLETTGRRTGCGGARPCATAWRAARSG